MCSPCVGKKRLFVYYEEEYKETGDDVKILYVETGEGMLEQI